MEEININTAVTGAEQCLLYDTNFNPVEQHNVEPNNPPASQASFHKDHTLAQLEDLPRDESENALSEVQSPLFIHAAAPTVSSETLLVPKGTVNGPVSHLASPTSSVNEDGVSLTTGQSAGQHKDLSTAAQEPSQPAVDQSFNSNHITDVAHSNDLSHSINQLPTSDSPINCEMQNCSDNDLKVDRSLAPQNERCQDTKSKLEKEEGTKLLTEVPEATDAPMPGNSDSTPDPQQDPVVNNEEATEKPQIVRTEKRRKRKMDVSQITRYNPDDMYNDMNDSPKDAELLGMDRLKHSDELLLVEPQEYSLMKVKSEPTFDEFGVSYSEEIVETVADYRYSPVNRFLDDASPNDFSLTDDDHVYYNSNDQESFYPCTKCNVNFREKKHLHRHMMYHLDGNNHLRHLNLPRPYACKECGRTFRDQTSRLKHMEIHQERRERLMEEIRELRDLQDEGRTARLQCPQCVFGTNCAKTFVQHAKTHEKDKQYYCCDECTFMAVSEAELECHRYIAHKVKMKSSMLDFEMSQRKAQRKLLLPSKKSPVFMCNLCPFNTSARNILRKHMEYLHPASCTDQLDDRFLDDRESDITSELFDFGSQAKQFLKQSTFPKNSILKPDLKRPYDSPSQTSSFKLFPRKQYNFQITKSDAQTARYFPQSSPNKTILVKKDQTPGYFNQIAKQKANYKLSSSYLYKEEYERYGLIKNISRPYSMNFKKEDGNPVTSESLLSNQGKTQNNSVLLDSHNVHAKRSDFSRDHNRAAMQGVKKIKREEAEEDLDNYTEFLDLLQKFDPSENKESFDTEDENSWGNGELGDYDSKSMEDKVSSNINQPHSEAYPHFRKVNDQNIDNEGNQSSQFKEEDYFFEYYDDPEDSFLPELHVDEHLEGAETGLPNHNSIFDWADLSLEKKNCPYCPAIFETGVGLSNHVRGHLHRAGLTYEARHVVSPERVVTNDKVQRFKRIATPIKRIRKAIEKSENPSEHTCQLCGGWFDTKIGLSNHVRGHLKRLGKTKWDAQKSPICVLNEMLQDEEKCEKIIKALNTRHILHRPFSARKLASGEDFTAPALPLEAHHNGLQTKATPVQVLQGLPLFPGLNGIKPDLGSETSHTLIELLKNKQLAGARSPDNSPQKNQGQTARKRFNQKCVLPINEDCTLMYQPRTPVDFSVVECKQKRSRSGSKKKGLPLPHSADEVYILRCRFCGLVFKGPLSVQEDWIKHLQRHIVNANLPRTGAGMVEIPSLLKKPPSISETSFSMIVAEGAS